MSDKKESIVLIGKRTRNILVNENGAYMVVKYNNVKEGEPRTFVARGSHLPDTDVAVRLTGWFEDDPKYGTQFLVQLSEINPPDTEDEFVQYVTSLKAGFTPKKARSLYQLLEPFAWDRLIKLDIPQKAEQIAGTESLQILCEKVRETSAERELVRLLSGKISVDISELRADGVTAETIRMNPYILCKYGPTFQTVDEFALTEGYAAPESPRRIESALHAALRNAALRGSSCLTGEILLRGDVKRGIEGAMSMLNRKKYTVSEDMAHGELMTVSQSRRIILNSGRFYAKEVLAEEIFVAKRLVELLQKKSKKDLTNKYVKAIQRYEKDEGITLSDEQRNTVLGVAKDPVMIVTGYPGAGKTTTIKAILSVLRNVEHVNPEDVLLLSPTGRAARRMEEATGHAASTVLSALKYTGRNKDELLKTDWTVFELPAKYIIVDEVSMIDLLQMAMLLKHIGDTTQLIMIGDPDQLPSVGAGNVLHDMIASSVIPVYKLMKIFRQKSSAYVNPIPLNAAKIRAGRTDLAWLSNSESAFALAPRSSDRKTYDYAVNLYERLVKERGLSVDDVALLCPFRKKNDRTQLTASVLNADLQKRVNPINEMEMTMTSKMVTYHKGDKVMQLVNRDYAKNGDIGYIEYIGLMPGDKEGDKMEKCAAIKFGDTIVQCNAKMMGEVDLAYASSVHKMQGTEVDTVLLVLTESHNSLLARNLVYTAITRATKHVVVIGSQAALNKAILRDNTVDPDMQRLTLLASRLHNEAEKAQKKK